MKKKFVVISFLAFFSGMLHADDYKWDLVNALVKNDFQKIENIVKKNADTMSASDKRLVVNFTINYSYGENTLNVLHLLHKYNIRPGSFDLYTAINRDQSNAVIQYMLSNGASPDGEILLLVMEKQRFDLAKQFIENGIDVNYQYPLTKNYADGMTPLLYASKWNNLELVKLLLEHGAAINAKAKDGNTALSLAQTNGNMPVYDYLKGHGAVEPENAPVPPPQRTGISGILDNQTINFQTGTYRLSDGAITIRFSGNANSGNIDYAMNGRVNKGIYKIENNVMTIIIEGKPFTYKIDSGMTFSGNGEVWARTGN